MTIRAQVLAVVNKSGEWIRASAIASVANLGYKPTIDALNALYNLGLVARNGCKKHARWGRLQLINRRADIETGALLNQCFRGFFA